MNPLRSLQSSILRKAVGVPKGGGARVERDIEVQMRDGVTLLHDHWIPLVPVSNAPVLLTRTPYGTKVFSSIGQMIADQGFHVVMQNVRGVFGSGGEFDPMFNEAADGLDTVAWIEQQDWYAGAIHTWGLSYLGMTQWALSAELPDSIRRMTIAVSARSFRDSVIRVGNGFGLETAVAWSNLLATQEGPLLPRLRAMFNARTIAEASDAIPPSEAVPRATGKRMAFVDDWLAHGATDPWWEPVVFAQDLRNQPPTVHIAGWYDLFIGSQIPDFEALQEAGRPAWLIVGPWTHTDLDMLAESVKEGLAGLQDPERADDQSPVRIKPVGSDQWLRFQQWPPPGRRLVLHCRPDGTLAETEPVREVSVSYRYDPADPTPAAGGASLNRWTAGRKDQAPREERDDVLTWTSSPLENDTLLAGNVEAVVRFASTNPRCDLFVRLCEVDEKGRSFNIADGYRRLDLGDHPEKPQEVTLRFPVGAAVRRGRWLRLQISSGAHPLHLRNPGTADPVQDFSELIASDQTIYLGPQGASVALPVIPTRTVSESPSP